MSNASNTMVRKASELDVGSRVVLDGAVVDVVRVHDFCETDGVNQGAWTSIHYDLAGSARFGIYRAGTLFTCCSR